MTLPSLEHPRLYLDIDGVILVENSPFETVDLNSIEEYAPEVVNRLSATALELILLSSWGKEATYLSDKIKALSRATIHPAPVSSDIYSKRDALIADQQRSPSPFVWADDMISSEIRQEVAKRLEVPHLLVQPDLDAGLTAADLESIEAFALQYKV